MAKENKLNLGCGADIRKDWINVDYFKKFNPDYCFDINKIPYPFEDNTFDEVLMKHIIEHLDKPIEVLKEINRICKNGAIIQINTPHFSSNNAWSDMEHKRPFSLDSFPIYCDVYKGFKILKQKITFSHYKFFMRPIVKLIPNFYEKHFAWIFSAIDLRTTMEAVKN